VIRIVSLFTDPVSLLLGLGDSLFFVVIAFYVYWALAYMTIAKKLNYEKPWLAWVPVANLFLLPILAGKRWVWGFLLLVPLVNIIFIILWTWRIYEQRNYPGWLSLIPLAGLIPGVGVLASVANLVIIGFVAWKDL